MSFQIKWTKFDEESVLVSLGNYEGFSCVSSTAKRFAFYFTRLAKKALVQHEILAMYLEREKNYLVASAAVRDQVPRWNSRARSRISYRAQGGISCQIFSGALYTQLWRSKSPGWMSGKRSSDSFYRQLKSSKLPMKLRIPKWSDVKLISSAFA